MKKIRSRRYHTRPIAWVAFSCVFGWTEMATTCIFQIHFVLYSNFFRSLPLLFPLLPSFFPHVHDWSLPLFEPISCVIGINRFAPRTKQANERKTGCAQHHFHRQCVFRFLWALLPLSAAFMRFIVCSIDRGSFQTHFHHITYTAYHGTHKLHETMFGMCYMTAERRKNAVQRGLYKEKSSKMDTGDRASLHYTAYRISHTVQSILFLAPPRWHT